MVTKKYEGSIKILAVDFSTFWKNEFWAPGYRRKKRGWKGRECKVIFQSHPVRYTEHLDLSIHFRNGKAKTFR